MLDLKDMGVRELNAEEMKNVNGGASSDVFTVVGVPLAAVGVAVGIATGGVGFALVGVAFAAGALVGWANGIPK